MFVRKSWPLLTVVLALACNNGKDATDDTDGDTDATPTVVDQCTETYLVPGAFGYTSTEGIDAHQAVFGETQAVRDLSVGPDPSQVHLGWPGSDTSNSISFVWNTDTGTLASQVKWGEGSALDRDDDGH